MYIYMYIYIYTHIRICIYTYHITNISNIIIFPQTACGWRGSGGLKALPMVISRPPLDAPNRRPLRTLLKTEAPASWIHRKPCFTSENGADFFARACFGNPCHSFCSSHHLASHKKCKIDDPLEGTGVYHFSPSILCADLVSREAPFTLEKAVFRSNSFLPLRCWSSLSWVSLLLARSRTVIFLLFSFMRPESTPSQDLG